MNCERQHNMYIIQGQLIQVDIQIVCTMSLFNYNCSIVYVIIYYSYYILNSLKHYTKLSPLPAFVYFSILVPVHGNRHL